MGERERGSETDRMGRVVAADAESTTSSDADPRALSTDDQAALSAFYYYVISSSAATSVIESGCVPVLHNPACTALLGYENSELAAIDVYDLLHPEHADTVAAAIDRVLSTPDSAESLDVDVIDKSRNRIAVRMTLTMATVAARDFVLAVSVPV